MLSFELTRIRSYTHRYTHTYSRSHVFAATHFCVRKGNNRRAMAMWAREIACSRIKCCLTAPQTWIERGALKYASCALGNRLTVKLTVTYPLEKVV